MHQFARLVHEPTSFRQRALQLRETYSRTVSIVLPIRTFAARLFASATVESLGERFMREHVLVHCKPSTQRENRRALMLFIHRKLGRLRVAEVRRAGVSEILHA
jgi:hypothetical protein